MLQYTIEDGIPGTEVFDVVQDDKGYIWLATNNGISKFTGKKFESFFKKDGLPDNSVIEFYKDQKSRIWISTYKNELACLANDSILPFKYNYKLKNYETSAVYCITSLAVLHDSIYLGWRKYIIIKIDLNGKIDTIEYNKKPLLKVHKLNDNNIVFSYGTLSYSRFLTTIHENDTSYTFRPLLKKTETQISRTKCATHGNNILTAYGKYLFLIKDYKIVARTIFESDVTKLKFDKEGNLIVCTYNNGIYFYIKSDIESDAKFNLLKGKTITSVYHDNEGGYWISTMRNGVFYIPSLDFQFFNNENGLKENFINNLTSGNNELWYTTVSNYIGYINKKKIKQFDLSNISSYKISYITFDKHENALWGGFEGGALPLFYANKNTIKLYKNSELKKNVPTRNFGMNVYAILHDHENIVLGGSVTLAFYKKNNKLFDFQKRKRKLSVHTMDFGKTKNEIWVGNRDGLYFVDDTIVEYYGNRKNLFRKRIIKLSYNKRNKQLWVATKNSGIYVLQNDKVKTITKKNGLSANNITALYVKDDKVWVGTTTGLDQITIKNYHSFDYEIQHFNENKGLVGNMINDIDIIEPNVYVATNQGISFFNYKKVKKNTASPRIYISHVKINSADTALKEKYRLLHYQNIIEIAYDGLNYSAPKEITYLYRLEGLHKDWQSTSSNQLEFTLLPPGKYNFEIYAVNEDGLKSEIPAAIEIIIKPPFYATWWFTSLVILSIILIVGLVFRMVYKVRVKEIRKRNLVEKELIKEQQKALGHQINPHFIFNTLSSIQYYLYKKDKISSSKYLEKFSQLMRNSLYNSQNEFISLKDEVKSLKTYIELEQLRFDEKFEFFIDIDENIDTYQIKIPAFLIQPYVENSIWHGINQRGQKGIITIDFRLQNDYILCQIVDNGIGRKASMQINKKRDKSHISLGGKIAEKRLKLINSLYNLNI